MDNKQSIPSLVDGLKPCQRTVLYTCIKRNDKREVYVAQLASSICAHSAYYHGEQELSETIIGLAQNFVGSNNINILLPIGQFGSRLQGGEDASNPRHLYTNLSPITKYLFSSLDTPLLNHIYDNKYNIEPEYYVPIIPMVLVNGAEGIGTGWSTKIPNYNPRDIVKNIYKMINGEEPSEMVPWCKNYKGTIERIDKHHFAVSGEIGILVSNEIVITELPIKVWTEAYIESVLKTMLHGTDKIPALITGYEDYYTDTSVRFVVTMTPEKLNQARRQGLHKVFKLQTTLSLSNMVLFDHLGCIRRFDSPEEILKEFFEVRSKLYERRKDYIVRNLEAESIKLKNQAMFIHKSYEDTIKIVNLKRIEMNEFLAEKVYDSNPVKAWKESQKIINEEEKGDESHKKDGKKDTSDPDYDYLLGMPLCKTKEWIADLKKKREEKIKELEDLKIKTPFDLWREDLKYFMEELDRIEKLEQEEEAFTIKSKGNPVSRCFWH